MWECIIPKHLYLVKYNISMNNKLNLIKQKIDAIRYGVLRFTGGSEPRTLQVRTHTDAGAKLNCIIKDNVVNMPLQNQEVSLIQKKDNDYLYIVGEIEDENDQLAVSLKIKRACWFTRVRKGSVVWLQEKYTYDISDNEMDKAS